MNQDLVAALGVKVVQGRIIVNDGTPYAASLNSEVVFVEALRVALEKLPVVEGKISFLGSPDSPYTHTQFEIVDKPNCTHKARLFAIEEIKKEPVKEQYGACVDKYGRLIMPVEFVNDRRFLNKTLKVTVEEILEKDLK